MRPEGLSGAIARATATLSPDALNSGAWAAVRTHLLDCVALIAAGVGDDRVQRATRVAGPPDPAFSLSIACGALGLDDFDEGTRAHPGAVLVPALIAAAAEHPHPISGGDLAIGLVSGYELFACLGAAMDAGTMHPRGRHPTAVLGVPAAALSVVRTLKCDTSVLEAAIGIGAGFSFGVTEFDEREVMRAVQTGWAASAGLRAARLAVAGFPASPHALEAPGGLLGREHSAAPTFTPVGSPFAVESASIKPYPHFSDLHPVTAAMLSLLRSRPVDATQVIAVRARITRRAASRLHTQLPPQNLKQAKRSPAFALATCIHSAATGQASGLLSAFAGDRVHDARVLDLAERIAVISDLPDDGDDGCVARVEITLADGGVLTGESAGYPGDGRDPQLRWNPQDAQERFRSLVHDASPPVHAAADAAADLVAILDQIEDVRPVACALTALPTMT